MGVLIPVLIITVLLIAGVAWWLLRKAKSKVKQDFLVVTGIRDIPGLSLPVVEAGRYAADEQNCEAWAINETLQRKDKETGRMVQLVCGWDCNPIDITGRTTGDVDKNFLSALASRVTAESKITYERKKQKNTVVMWVGIIGVILAISISVPLLMQISSGKLSLPNPTNILQQDLK